MTEHPQIKDLPAQDERKAPEPHPRPLDSARAQIKQFKDSLRPRIVRWIPYDE